MPNRTEFELAGVSRSANNAPSVDEIVASKRQRIPSQRALGYPTRARAPAPTPTPPATQVSIATTQDLADEDTIIVNTQRSFESGLLNAPTPDEKQKEISKKKTEKECPLEQWEIDLNEVRRTQPRNKALQRSIICDGIDALPDSTAFPECMRIEERDCEVDYEAIDAENLSPEQPLSLFYKFIPEAQLELFALYTNQQAALVEADQFSLFEQPRTWRNTTGAEIGAFFGAFLLMGVSNEDRLIDFWDTSTDRGAIGYNWTSLMPHSRFDQLSRYLKINPPEQVLDDEDWYGKVGPLAETFRKASIQLVRPGSRLTVDEQLVSAKGRSKHIIRIENKAAGQGYKFYTLCGSNGYLYDFLPSSKSVKVLNLKPYKPILDYWQPDVEPRKQCDFTDSDKIVLQLIEGLLKQWPGQYKYMLGLDNFFINHRLLSELKEWGVGACGTCKPGAHFLKIHLALDRCTSKAVDYGLEKNTVLEGVNCVIFVDQKAVHLMTTIHDSASEEPHWRDTKTRPRASHE